METNRLAAAPVPRTGQVTTFYAYDAAAPRSQALVTAAWLLAGRDPARAPVLMIDWDLEGPGLHHYVARARDAHDARTMHMPHDGRERDGVLELFEACRAHLQADAGEAIVPGAAGPAGSGPHGDDDAYATAVLDALDLDAYIERVDDGRPLYLMRAGRVDESYGERADRLDWDALFCACPALFRSFAARLTRRFAHVLIDCRGGRSAATSVCTALLPDKMVGLFTTDPRSLDGLQGVVSRALDYRRSHEEEQRPLLVYPVPSPVDACAAVRQHWRFGDGQRGRDGYQGVLERLLGDSYGVSGLSLASYLDEVQLPQAGMAAIAPSAGGARSGGRERLGAVRSIEAMLEWVEPGHFPWRPLAEVRLIEAVQALRARADDAHAPALVRELARELGRLGQLYLGQQGELEAARRIEQHVIALEAGLHAMEEGKHGPATRRRHGDASGDGLDEKLSRLQEMIDGHHPREARSLADHLRGAILRPGVAHPLRRRGAAMIKQVYQQDGDRDALMAFMQDEVAYLERVLIQTDNACPLVPG